MNIFRRPSARFAREPGQTVQRRQELLTELRKLRVGLLSGGRSDEREVSLSAGASLISTLAELGIPHLLIDPDDLLRVLAHRECDLLFNVLYGELGEGGAVRSLADYYGIPCVYSNASASALALDKWRTKLLAQSVGVPTSWTRYVDKANVDATLAELTVNSDFPLICKPNRQGSSVGIERVRDAKELGDVVPRAVRRFGPVILEPFLPGREFSVGVIDTDFDGLSVLPVVEICLEDGLAFDTAAKYSPGVARIACPASTDEHTRASLESFAVSTHLVLGCRPVSRMDFREDSTGSLFLLEANHYPGMTPRSILPLMASQAGLEFSDLTLEILHSALSMPSQGTYLASGICPPSAGSGPVVIVPSESSLKETCMAAAHFVAAEYRPPLTILTDVEVMDLVVASGLETVAIECLYGTEWDDCSLRGALDALGVMRTGPSILTSALAADKRYQKLLARSLGIPTAPWHTVSAVDDVRGIWFPCVVKPVRGSQSSGLRYVADAQTWTGVLASLIGENLSDWIVEPYLPGREFYVGLLTHSNGSIETLPLLELHHDGDASLNDAASKNTGQRHTSIVSDLPLSLAADLRGRSLEAHRAFGHAPIARVEWRLDGDGTPNLIEYDHTPGLTADSYVTAMLQSVGYTLRETLAQVAWSSGLA